MYLRIVQLLITLLSIVINLLIPMIYLKSKTARHHPAKLYQTISIIESFQAFHFLVWMLEKEDQFFEWEGLCLLNQSAYHIFVVLDVSYNICLCIDVALTLRYPLYPGKRRLKYYDVTSWLTAGFVYFIIKDRLAAQCSPNNKHTYFRLFYVQVLVVLLALAAFWSVILGVKNYKNTANNQLAIAKKTYILRHLTYILLLFIFQILPSFRSMKRMLPGLEDMDVRGPLQADGYEDQRQNHWLDSLCFMLTISSGLILSVFRLTEHQFFVHVKTILLKQGQECNQQYINDDHAVWQVPLAHMVNATNSHQLIKHVLLALVDVLSDIHKQEVKDNADETYKCYKLRVKQTFHQKLCAFSQQTRHVLKDELQLNVKKHREQQKRLQKLVRFFKMKSQLIDKFVSDFREKVRERLEKNGVHIQEEVKKDIKRKSLMQEDKNNNETLKIRLQITEYAPRLFKRLRNLDGIDNEDIINSLDIVQNGAQMEQAKESAGKSGSFFIMSADNKFILKTICSEEVTTLINLLPFYFEHIVFGCPDSLLCRLYGAFTINIIGMSPIHLLLMENTSQFIKRINKTYDLKGSLVNRSCRHSQTVLMDLDFIRSSDQQVDLVQEQEDNIISVLKKDSKFLKDNELMDYSLLYLVGSEYHQQQHNNLRGYQQFRRMFAKNNKEYCFSIIDYLQRFNRRKFLEMYFKKLVHYRDSDFVSCQHQDTYSKRFISFIKPIFSNKIRKNQELINAFMNKKKTN